MGKLDLQTCLTEKMKEVANEGTPDITGKIPSS